MTDAATRDHVRVDHFDANPRSARSARELVAEAVADWGLQRLHEIATLCAGELAANAVLHGRGPFDVVVRRLGDAVRIEVIDRRPEEVPAAVPDRGTAVDITRQAATGRGLQIVASLARRWGYTTSAADKAVWAEVATDTPGTPTEPVRVEGWQARPRAGDIHLDLRSMPVRTAVASGVQLDELVREIQLGPDVAADPSAVAELYHLLDVSAPARLGGRHAALRAAAVDDVRFDFQLDAPLGTLAAVADLTLLLEAVAIKRGGRIRVPPDVSAYRTWLREEGLRQLAGEPPASCPLP